MTTAASLGPHYRLHSAITRALRTSPQKKNDFLFAIDALISHRKPAILLDFAVTPTNLQSIFHNCGLSDVITIVILLDDIILVDPSHDFITNYSPVLIDCSRYRTTPTFADTAVTEQYNRIFCEMVSIVVSAGGHTPVVNLDTMCRDDVCLTTIFGMFLQYPYVYYTSDDGNCLAGVELIVVELGMVSPGDESTVAQYDAKTVSISQQLDRRVFTSFSVPRTLCKEEGEERKLRDIPYYLSQRTVTLDCVAM